MTSEWQPFKEPIRQTLLRTVAIAVVVSGAIALSARRWFSLPQDTLLVLWVSLGGHWVEVWFLNWLRPRVSPARVAQLTARVVVWFAGGTALVFGMALTAMLLAGFRSARWPAWSAWWIGGFAFIGVELVAHLVLQLRGRPSFYNGCG